MTIDDQLEALRPLPPGAVAVLAGYARGASVSVQRFRGRKIPAERLRLLAAHLRALAAIAEEMSDE
jgi:hypothetical protein